MVGILNFIRNIGSGELLLILLVCLVLFGAKRIPELARALGKGIQEFKKATQESLEEPKQKSSKTEEE
jgi:sec-independent protein translocase protein TatA